MNLEERYCSQHHCDHWGFQRAVFWKCLYPHAVPIAFLLGGPRSSFFARDFEFIGFAGRSESPAALREEITEFRGVPENTHWLRRFLRIRISTTRFARLAQVYFKADTSGGAPPLSDGSRPPLPVPPVHEA
jgi:hypothetical protein